ncbi:hypothetical protein AAX26_01784 [Aliarcobacter thereius]|uniref:ATP-binding protein n=1 Tax=Aliarcobacter thereius TaxID=544718 RepID=UPI000828EE59|nr:ATP-binding protein [Aliarcobacter thereius]OCL85717.1 hypothetical protein AAX26_01784 [Aliarcobacter thereius]
MSENHQIFLCRIIKMQVTTRQIVKKLPTNLKLMSVLNEAITNSIQADATEIEIFFETIDISLLNDSKKVKNITIIDNGKGFTDKSIISFNHYMSDYKQHLGCKGIGRFTYLTICEKIAYESYNNGKNIKFYFDLDTEEIKPKIIENQELVKKTKLKYIGIIDKEVSSDLNIEAKEIINHFLSIFKFMIDENNEVVIKLYLDDELKDTINSKEHGSNFVDEDFIIKIGNIEESFKISYKQKGSSIKGFYCADKRSVKQDDLNINFRTSKDKGLLFFVTSPFFDKTVNDERTGFNIKDNDKNLLSFDWDIINRKLFSKINSISKELGIDIENINNKNKKESLNSAPYLATYIQKSQNLSTSAEIIKEAKELFNKDKDYIRNIKNRNKSDYEERLYASNQAELAEYIFDREKIILDIKKDIEDPLKKSNETIIHNKIMKKHTINKNYKSYKDNNLWLFDERFMIYTYAYSDKTINEILGVKDDLTRPDICIFTKTKDDIQDIVIIELKGNDATGEKNAGGLTETNKYTFKIKQYFESKKIDVRIWSYLITNLGKDEKAALDVAVGVHKSYTPKGEMYYIYNDKLNSTTHIYSLETMIEDAMSRNQLFLDILKGKID